MKTWKKKTDTDNWVFVFEGGGMVSFQRTRHKQVTAAISTDGQKKKVKGDVKTTETPFVLPSKHP
jgi:hypothetical protein